MAKLLKLRRGTTTQHGSFTGEQGEVTVDTDKTTLVVHPGGTQGGGEAMLREDLNNMPNSGVTAGTYGSSSAIPSITVDAKGLVTSATTSAIDSTSIANGTSNVSVAASGDITVTRSNGVVGTFASDGLRFNDNIIARFGTGNDFAIFHDGGNSILDHSGTGGLRIVCNNDDSDITLESDNGAGSTTTYVRCDGSNGSVKLYDYGNEKLSTSGGGINVTGTVACDGLQCDGTATISSTTGSLKIQDSNSTGNAAENYIYGANSDNSTRWYLGQASGSVQDLYVQNQASAAIRFGTNGTARAYVTASGHFIPANNNTYDLGDTSNRWRNVYTNDLNLSNEGGTNDVDGTWGSWTIQEGEDDLFLLNRRNGKKYKFNLSEVN